MTRWSMVIDLDKCVACQGCTVACRFENNTPAVAPQEAAKGRAIRWNDVFPMPVNQFEDTGIYPNVVARYIARQCIHCENPACIKVCPVQATYKDEQGLIRQNYERCICCRFCTVACPYGVRYGAPRRPADLARWPLLDLDDSIPGAERMNWTAWFEFAGAGAVEPAAGRLVFSFIDQAVQAAVRGQGVALVRSPFLQDCVASGDLVMPFPKLRMPAGYRHVLVVNPASAERPHVAAFCEWVAGQFRRVPQLLD